MKNKMASAVTDRGGRFLWTDQATLKVLNLIRELDVVHVLKSKRQRNQQTFMTIEELLSPLGYDWSWQQIRCHWKNLKSRYNHERRNLRPGQKSSWKYYNVMDSLLKQQTRAGDLASGRGDDSENSSGAENSAGQVSIGNDEYIVPTVQESSTGSSGTAIMQHLGASASSELGNTVGADTVLVKKGSRKQTKKHIVKSCTWRP
ncbi:hypothetical protein MTO96_010778 [Rhipicephalus appendiculatus]